MKYQRISWIFQIKVYKQAKKIAIVTEKVDLIFWILYMNWFSNQLGTVNEEMENVNRVAKELEEKQKYEKEMQILCEIFIKGQGSIYVLGECNWIEKDEGIEENGPKYVEHAWNERTIGKSMIEQFLSSSGGGHQIFPKYQEYAITIAVSSSLLKKEDLAEYQSDEFPNITFNSNEHNGSIYIVNGHHRIAAWKHVHDAFLTQLHKYESILKNRISVASDDDTREIKEAHSYAAELQKKLFSEGGWGAVVLDYGQPKSNIHKIVE